jgi:hypothetical protein
MKNIRKNKTNSIILTHFRVTKSNVRQGQHSKANIVSSALQSNIELAHKFGAIPFSTEAAHFSLDGRITNLRCGGIFLKNLYFKIFIRMKITLNNWLEICVISSFSDILSKEMRWNGRMTRHFSG